MKLDAKSTIETGKAILGIELGSTRIKAVLIDQENKPIAQGSHTWENQLVDGLWTYSIEAIWSGLQDCYADLRSNTVICRLMKKKKYSCHSVLGETLIQVEQRQPCPNYLSTTFL